MGRNAKLHADQIYMVSNQSLPTRSILK